VFSSEVPIEAPSCWLVVTVAEASADRRNWDHCACNDLIPEVLLIDLRRSRTRVCLFDHLARKSQYLLESAGMELGSDTQILTRHCRAIRRLLRPVMAWQRRDILSRKVKLD
jgi:hypothetical protein